MSTTRGGGLGAQLRRAGEAPLPPGLAQRVSLGAFEKLERPRRGLIFPALTGLAGAAAAVAALFLLGGRVPGPNLPPVASAPLPAPPAGTAIEAGVVSSQVALGDHRLRISAGSRLLFEQSDPAAAELRVEDGRVGFAVEHLADGQSFRVRTDAVLVEVVGTRFDVSAEGGCSRVAVAEGRVRITPTGRAPLFLDAGSEETFCPTPQQAAAIPGEELLREALELVATGERLPEAAALLRRYGEEQPGGVFEEEAIFHLCLLEARLGRRSEAERLAAGFFTRFPQSRRAERLRSWLGESR